tara:strand:+ start:615 stop:1043 length:429 start_codon:yes stop_codon:yes gene_type:complete
LTALGLWVGVEGMKKYIVFWKRNKEGEVVEREIEAGSPKAAYREFLGSEPEILDQPVVVEGRASFAGLPMGYLESEHFEEHIDRTKEAAEPENSKQEEINGASSVEQKLDKIYGVLDHIRWIGIGIGCMFAMTFIFPKCSGS